MEHLPGIVWMILSFWFWISSHHRCLFTVSMMFGSICWHNPCYVTESQSLTGAASVTSVLLPLTLAGLHWGWLSTHIFYWVSSGLFQPLLSCRDILCFLGDLNRKYLNRNYISWKRYTYVCYFLKLYHNLIIGGVLSYIGKITNKCFENQKTSFLKLNPNSWHFCLNVFASIGFPQ